MLARRSDNRGDSSPSRTLVMFTERSRKTYVVLDEAALSTAPNGSFVAEIYEDLASGGACLFVAYPTMTPRTLPGSMICQ